MATNAEGEPSELPHALETSEEVTREVRQAADDLAVVHAVLETHKPQDATNEDALKAIAETAAVEKRLAEAADKLSEVTDALQREIANRGTDAARA